MEIAVHLRSPALGDLPGNFSCHLAGIYADEMMINGDKAAGTAVSRIYIGDEFCFHRLPKRKEIDDFCRIARRDDLDLTLLTTPMTQPQLESFSPVFGRLEDAQPGAEVVANDVGVLFYLGKNHSGLRISAGRLLNKGYADPRQEISGKGKNNRLIGGGALGHTEFLSVLTHAGVRRVEHDLSPHADQICEKVPGMETSIYFPFGYAAMGRMCWIASYAAKGRKKFLIADACSRPCDGLTLEMKHDDFKAKVFQNGNTVYYQYPPDRVRELLKKAAENEIRLVYQGYAVLRP